MADQTNNVNKSVTNAQNTGANQGKPSSAPPPQNQQVTLPAQKGQKGNTVLIIEDDPLLIKMYKAKFESEGLRVLSAHDGEEGLKMALEGGADLILLDIMMPKLSGVDLLASLRRDPRGKDTLVIVYSNLAQEEEAKRAIELGAKEYIIKANMTPGQMVEKVKAYLARKKRE